MSLFRKYPNDPKSALKELFENQSNKTCYLNGDRVFLCQGSYDLEGTGYVSHRLVSPDELKNRPHEVYWCDYEPAITWLDEWHFTCPARSLARLTQHVRSTYSSDKASFIKIQLEDGRDITGKPLTEEQISILEHKLKLLGVSNV